MLAYTRVTRGPLQITERLEKQLPLTVELAKNPGPFRSAARAVLREAARIDAAYVDAEALYLKWLGLQEHLVVDVRNGVVNAVREIALPLSRICAKRANSATYLTFARFLSLADSKDCREKTEDEESIIADAAEELAYLQRDWERDAHTYGCCLIQAHFIARIFASNFRSSERKRLERAMPAIPNLRGRRNNLSVNMEAEAFFTLKEEYERLPEQERTRVSRGTDNESLAWYLGYALRSAGFILLKLRVPLTPERYYEDYPETTPLVWTRLWLTLSPEARYAIASHETAISFLSGTLRGVWMVLKARRQEPLPDGPTAHLCSAPPNPSPQRA